MAKQNLKSLLLLSDVFFAALIFILVVELNFNWLFVLFLIPPIIISLILFEKREYLYFVLIYTLTDILTAYFTNGLEEGTFIAIIVRTFVLLVSGETVLWIRKRYGTLSSSLEKSEQKFQTLLNYTYDWEYYITKNGHVEYSSPSCEKITQYTHEEFQENPGLLLDIVHPDDMEIVKAHYQEELANRNPDPIQFRILKKNGDFRVIRHTCNPVLDEAGKFIGVRVTNRNATDRWRAEEELRKNEKKYRYIFENLIDVYFQTTIEGEILIISPSIKNISGYSADELIGKNASMFYKDTKAREKYIEILVKQGSVNGYEVEFVDKNGTTKILSFNTKLIYDDADNPVAIEGVFRDVTDEHKIKKALEEEKNKFQALFETNLGGVYLTDIEGNIIECNQATANILGFSSVEEFKKQNAFNVYSDPNDRKEFLRKLKQKKQILGFEHPLRRKDGSKVWIIENCRMLDEKRIIGTLFDITELRNTLERLKESEKDLREANAAKDRFFSIIAHDVRSPFASLLGLTEMIYEDWDEMSGEEKKQAVTHIKSVAERIFKLLEALLEWSRIQTNRIEFEPQDFNLEDMIESLVFLYLQRAKEKNIRLNINIDSNIKVYTDENMLSTVMRNLVSNALKFTPINGKISISGELEKEHVKVCIADTGVGMDRETMGKLFRIDEKISNKGTEGELGTGLGLILCSELVKKMGGAIWVESELGKGSKFFFTLPKVG